MSSIIVDVREPDEFEAEHVENAICLPLSRFKKAAPGVLNQLKGKDVVIMCRSGARAGLALEQCQLMGFTDGSQFKVYPGGIQAWKAEGKPVLTHQSGHFPLMRQVQLAAGLLVLSGTVLTFTVSPYFGFLTGFVGMGLTVAGSTGFCGMAILLSKMPWNQKPG